MKSDHGVPIPSARRSALVLVPRHAGQDVVLRTLRQDKIRTRVAQDPYRAVALCLSEPAKLLVVSLEGLRRRDRAFLRELRRYSPDVRVLLLVPEGRRADVPAFLEAGADALLQTPVHPTELHYVVRSLLRSAAADPLTSLPNRGAYELALAREMARASREGRTLGFALIDLDGFGTINHRYGLKSGDRVLARVARRLRRAFRFTDLVTRWGGEEFAVLLTALPLDPADAMTVVCEAVERARDRVRDRDIRVRASARIRVTFSAGLALFPHDATDADGLFDKANERLEDAKDRGRDRIEPCFSTWDLARRAAETPPPSAAPPPAALPPEPPPH